MRETDEELYRVYLAEGSEDALRELLLRHRESLTLFLFGYVRNMDDAEELMLDAFAAAASGTARFDGRSSFKTWLFAIGRNLALKEVRRRRVVTVPLDEAMTAEEEQAEFTVLAEERRRLLFEALSKLPEDYRQALYLLYFEEADAEETARIMKKTRRQVYNLTARGKAELKKILEGMGFTYETA